MVIEISTEKKKQRATTATQRNFSSSKLSFSNDTDGMKHRISYEYD